MPNNPTLEEQITQAGLNYSRRHDVSYRAGLVLQVLGLSLLAVLYPLQNAFYTLGIMLFDMGVLLSAVYLLVWMKPVKRFILAAVLTGLALQIAGSLVVSEQHAGTLILAGIGFVCMGASGMVGKEAYCFGYKEGWALALFGFPVMVLANLLARENIIFNALGFSVLFLLILSLTGKKLKQPLLSKCATGVCGAPNPEK
jgi:uncharacterized integral membrane protein